MYWERVGRVRCYGVWVGVWLLHRLCACWRLKVVKMRRIWLGKMNGTLSGVQ